MVLYICKFSTIHFVVKKIITDGWSIDIILLLGSAEPENIWSKLALFCWHASEASNEVGAPLRILKKT